MLGRMLINGLVAAILVGAAAGVYAQAVGDGPITVSGGGREHAEKEDIGGHNRNLFVEKKEGRHDTNDFREHGHDEDDD